MNVEVAAREPKSPVEQAVMVDVSVVTHFIRQTRDFMIQSHDIAKHMYVNVYRIPVSHEGPEAPAEIVGLKKLHLGLKLIEKYLPDDPNGINFTTPSKEIIGTLNRLRLRVKWTFLVLRPDRKKKLLNPFRDLLREVDAAAKAGIVAFGGEVPPLYNGTKDIDALDLKYIRFLGEKVRDRKRQKLKPQDFRNIVIEFLQHFVIDIYRVITQVLMAVHLGGLNGSTVRGLTQLPADYTIPQPTFQ